MFNRFLQFKTPKYGWQNPLLSFAEPSAKEADSFAELQQRVLCCAWPPIISFGRQRKPLEEPFAERSAKEVDSFAVISTPLLNVQQRRGGV